MDDWNQRKITCKILHSKPSATHLPDVKTSVTARHWWMTLSFSKYNANSWDETLLNVLCINLLNVLQTGSIIRMMVKFMTGTVPRAMHNPCYVTCKTVKERERKCSTQTSKSCVAIYYVRTSFITYPKYFTQVIKALIFTVNVIGLTENKQGANQPDHLDTWYKCTCN